MEISLEVVSGIFLNSTESVTLFFYLGAPNSPERNLTQRANQVNTKQTRKPFSRRPTARLPLDVRAMWLGGVPSEQDFVTNCSGY